MINGNKTLTKTLNSKLDSKLNKTITSNFYKEGFKKNGLNTFENKKTSLFRDFKQNDIKLY